MAVMLITYDLISPGQKYEELYEQIKSAANGYCHLLDSTWLIVTSMTADAVSTHVRKVLDDNDELLVVSVGGDAKQGWLDKSKWEWINQHWQL